MPRTAPDILEILFRCFDRMKAVFRLPAIWRGEKMPADLASEPAFDKLVRICLDLSGMPFTDDKKDMYKREELLDFIDYWCSDHVSDRLTNATTEILGNGDHFLAEFEKLLQITADLRKEVTDFEHIKPSNSDVHDVHRQLLLMTTENRYKITELVDESTKKMKQTYMDGELDEAKVQSTVNELTARLAVCESSYESELKRNAAEAVELTELLSDMIESYDKKMTSMYCKLFQLNDNIERQQQTNCRLDEAFDKQATLYHCVLNEQQRVWNAKLQLFRENRAAKIIQRAYLQFRLEKQKKLRRMKRRGRKK